MIQQTTAYRVGELFFPTIQEAQKQEILDLCKDPQDAGKESPPEDVTWANFIVEHTDEIVAILTCEPRTKKIRSDKGTRRKPKTVDGAE